MKLVRMFFWSTWIFIQAHAAAPQHLTIKAPTDAEKTAIEQLLTLENPHANQHKRVKKILLCEECGKKYQYQSLLIIHKRSHTKEKPFTCPHCSQAFSQRSNYKTHIKKHHKQISAP